MPAFEIPHTEAFEVNGMAVLLDQNDGPRHLAGRNFLADQIADALQFRGRKTFKRSKLRLGTARASASQRESHDPKRKRRPRFEPSVLDRLMGSLLERPGCAKFSGRLNRHKGCRIPPARWNAVARSRWKSSRRRPCGR